MKGLRLSWVAAGAVCIAPIAAQSGWKDLTGKPVPAIFASAWLNTNGESPNTATLKGKVWLLEFFATT